MSKIYADTIETENSNVDITLGASGDAVLIPTGATLKTNKIADAGGNNIITSDGSGSLTVDSQLQGNEVLLATNTFTGTTTSNFTTKITSAYNVYIFRWNAINPATDAVKFTFQGSTDGGSNYNTSMTTTYFAAYNYENDSGAALGYDGGQDQGNGTAYQPLCNDIGNDADQNEAGELFIFNPASTVYVKHFTSIGNQCGAGDYTQNQYAGGYFNTASAINAISFTMSSGNMDGTIRMYGMSTT